MGVQAVRETPRPYLPLKEAMVGQDQVAGLTTVVAVVAVQMQLPELAQMDHPQPEVMAVREQHLLFLAHLLLMLEAVEVDLLMVEPQERVAPVVAVTEKTHLQQAMQEQPTPEAEVGAVALLAHLTVQVVQAAPALS